MQDAGRARRRADGCGRTGSRSGSTGPTGAKLVRTERVELDVTGERTEVPELVGVAQPDLVLVNDDDLTYAKVRLDERSLATVVARVADIDDPLPRTLCWGAAWDMTRDGEMRARDYVDAGAGRRGRGRPRSASCSRSRRKIRSGAGALRRPGLGAGRLGPAGRGVGARSCARPRPGSDLQLAWARTLAAAARTPEQLAVVRGLLDGSGAVPGLAVDTELRWTLLSSLVALGAAGSDEIEDELDRDPTASGQRRAATARALRPDPGAKAEAWRLATEDDELPNAINEAIIGGFSHPAQTELTSAYASRTSRSSRRLGAADQRDRAERRGRAVPGRGVARGGRGGRGVPGRPGHPARAAPAGRRGPRRHGPLAARPRPGRPSRLTLPSPADARISCGGGRCQRGAGGAGSVGPAGLVGEHPQPVDQRADQVADRE